MCGLGCEGVGVGVGADVGEHGCLGLWVWLWACLACACPDFKPCMCVPRLEALHARAPT